MPLPSFGDLEDGVEVVSGFVVTALLTLMAVAVFFAPDRVPMLLARLVEEVAIPTVVTVVVLLASIPVVGGYAVAAYLWFKQGSF